MSLHSTVGSVVRTSRDRNVTLLAAGFAYYAFVSVVPLAILLLAVGSLVGHESFARLVLARVEGLLSRSGQRALSEALTGGTGRAGASVVGLVTLSWSGLNVFRGLATAFDEVYEHVRDATLREKLRDAVLVLTTMSLAVAVLVLLGTVFAVPAVATLPLPDLLGTVALLVGLSVVLLPLYYVLPPVDVSAREALPGAVAAAAGWLALRTLFELYAANAAAYQAYGLLGGVLLFVTWLYAAGIIILVGAVLNVVLARE
jgi:membrane protein